MLTKNQPYRYAQPLSTEGKLQRLRVKATGAKRKSGPKQGSAAGAKIAAGTDAGGHGHPSNAMEIECLVKAGLTPLQALQAATGWAAECLGLERDIGTVEKGKLADLIVVAGDPLSDVTMLQNPERIALVLKGGEIAADRLGKGAR